jgi:hypothetical protein
MAAATPAARGGQLLPVVRVGDDHHRRGRRDEQRDVPHRLQGQAEACDHQQELVEARPAQRETRHHDEDHRFEWPQVDLVEVRREPFDDELLLRHAALRLERVQKEARPVRGGEHRDQ